MILTKSINEQQIDLEMIKIIQNITDKQIKVVLFSNDNTLGDGPPVSHLKHLVNLYDEEIAVEIITVA